MGLGIRASTNSNEMGTGGWSSTRAVHVHQRLWSMIHDTVVQVEALEQHDRCSLHLHAYIKEKGQTWWHKRVALQSRRCFVETVPSRGGQSAALETDRCE